MSAAVQAAERRKGYAITLLGVLILSPDAVLLRLIGGDEGAILGWRGGLAALTIALILCFRGFGGVWASLRTAPWATLSCALLYAGSSGSFVVAVSNAPASTVLVIIAVTPLMAALAGWLVLAERPDRRSMRAILLGVAGAAVAGGGAALGGEGGGAAVWLGVAAALGATASMAAQFTILRRFSAVDSFAAVLIGSALLGIIGFVVSDPLALPPDRIPYAVALGAVVTPLSFILIMIGPRYLPGAEVSLMLLLETFLGPLWVWALLDEAPGRWALLGGALIVWAVALSVSQAFGGRRGEGKNAA